MFVPIHDENPLKSIRFPYVNVAIIVINVAVFLLFQLSDLIAVNECGSLSTFKAFGMIPMELRGTDVPILACAGIPRSMPAIPELATLLSYMFLHGDVWHLLFNMAFLWVFGDNIEDAVGHVRYLAFYLLCGVAGALLHFTLQPDSLSPLVGASGAISGVVAAYLMLHPRVHLWVLIMRFFPLRLRAVWPIGIWIVANVVLAFVPSDPLVAWWAHIGGLLAGALLVPVMKRRDVPLFDRGPAAAR